MKCKISYKFCIRINFHYRLHAQVDVLVVLELNYIISVVHNNTVLGKILVILTCRVFRQLLLH